jgi:hypothetical protein
MCKKTHTKQRLTTQYLAQLCCRLLSLPNRNFLRLMANNIAPQKRWNDNLWQKSKKGIRGLTSRVFLKQDFNDP